jgi:hypothetical protein
MLLARLGLFRWQHILHIVRRATAVAVRIPQRHITDSDADDL